MSGRKIPEGPLSAATPEMAVPELSERQGFKVREDVERTRSRCAQASHKRLKEPKAKNTDMTPSIRLAGPAGSRSGHAGGITLDGLIQEISECYEIVQMHDN